MELKFAIASAVEMLIVVLVIYGFWHENSLIAFEERIEDATARWLAKKIVTRRGRGSVDRCRPGEKTR